MRPVQTQTLTAVGVTNPLVLDPRGWANSTDLTVIMTGTLTAKVQYTNDDVFDPAFNPATANWIDHPTLTGLTVTSAGNFGVPVMAVRLNVTAYTSGSAYLRVIQGSSDGT